MPFNASRERRSLANACPKRWTASSYRPAIRCCLPSPYGSTTPAAVAKPLARGRGPGPVAEHAEATRQMTITSALRTAASPYPGPRSALNALEQQRGHDRDRQREGQRSARLERPRQPAIAQSRPDEPAHRQPEERKDAADDADQNQQRRELLHSQPQRDRRKQLDVAAAQHVQGEDREQDEQRHGHSQEMVERGVNAGLEEQLKREQYDQAERDDVGNAQSQHVEAAGGDEQRAEARRDDHGAVRSEDCRRSRLSRNRRFDRAGS